MSDISNLFRVYKEATKARFSVCEDSGAKIVALEAFVDELLDQNELLIETVEELQIVSRNRWEQLESRLLNSANATQESALHLQEYEKTLKTIVNDCLSSASDCECDELHNHITALKIENSFLRDQNENLKHDLENVLKVVKLKKGKSEGVGDCYDFCDSLSPEDVFGSIERISTVDKAVDVSPVRVEESVVEQVTNEDPEQKQTAKKQIQFDSDMNLLTSIPSQTLLEEKQLFITKIQEHLQNLTNETELKDEVIKKLEMKLSTTRKENEEIKQKCANLESKFTSILSLKDEAEERINTLNEQRRSLMIQLDEQSDMLIKCKEELNISQKQTTELKKRNDLQSKTIQHLRDAIKDQVKVLTSNRSANMQQDSLYETEVSGCKSSQ